MIRPLLKVCGVTREEEIASLAECGVDFFGLVTDVPSPWALRTDRVRELAACGSAPLRPTLVTKPQPLDTLARLIEATGVTAIQLGVLTLPKHIRQLRRMFPPGRLVVIQHIPYRQGRFPTEEQAEDYVMAGADFLLLDRLDTPAAADRPAHATIPEADLMAFRARHPDLPLLLAGGVSAENVQPLLAASRAMGIDVCSSVRRDGTICRELVAQLMARLAESAAINLPLPLRERAGARGQSNATTSGSDVSAKPGAPRATAGLPSSVIAGFSSRTTRQAGQHARMVDELLKAAPPGNQVLAYLTIGDPPARFLDVAEEALAAGALTLELGFPHAKPQEGAALAASHRRALAAGVDTAQAFALFQTVAGRHLHTPLVAVVQWPAIQAEDERRGFLDGLVEAGAAAVLAVGLPLWQLPAFAAEVHGRGLQVAFPCPPNATRKFRDIAFRYSSACVYVPRGRTTGGAQEFAGVADFCRLVAAETNTPIVVGVGVQNAADVSEICNTPARAAAVGSALVEHVTRGGSAAEFVRRLLAR